MNICIHVYMYSACIQVLDIYTIDMDTHMNYVIFTNFHYLKYLSTAVTMLPSSPLLWGGGNW
jgi:hypothetical protein